MTFTLYLIGPISYTTHTVSQLDIRTTEGDLVIYANHAPLIAQLEANQEFSYTTGDGTQERKHIAGGIIHVERTTVTIIMDT